MWGAVGATEEGRAFGAAAGACAAAVCIFDEHGEWRVLRSCVLSTTDVGKVACSDPS